MPRGHISLNVEGYALDPFEMDGETALIHRTTLAEFVESLGREGQQQQTNVSNYSSKIFGPLTGGHGLKRILSRDANDPHVYTRFWDSDGTITWFPTDARIRLLEVDNTHAGLEVLRATWPFKGELWGMWEDDTSTDLVARNFTGSDGGGTWENGGDILADSNIKVGLDMIAHSSHLIAGLATLNDHLIMRSTDGASWVAPTTQLSANELSNNVTANEDIDAGLLAVINDEVVWVEFRETTADIIFHSSSDIGDNWTGEAPVLASGGGVKGVGVLAGIDDGDKLYVGTREGLWEVDTAPSPWVVRFIFGLAPHDDNARRMTVHNASLYFSQGVDNNSPAPVFRMFNTDGTRHFESGWGLDVDDGVPSDMLGPIRWMKSAGTYLLASVGGGTTGRQARVILRNTNNPRDKWHTVRKHGTENQKIELIEYSADDDGTPRIHYSIRTSSSVSDLNTVANPLTNPSSGVGHTHESTSFVDHPEMDGGMPSIDAAFLQARVNAASLSSGATGEHINIDFGFDGDAQSTTDLGNILDGTRKLDFAGGAGDKAFSVGMRTNLLRGSTNTNSPQFRSLEIDYLKQPERINRWWFKVNLQATADQNDLDIETVVTNLETARDKTADASKGGDALVAFVYANMTEVFVKVKEIRWAEDLTEPGGDVEVAADTAARRGGTALVRVEQVID